MFYITGDIHADIKDFYSRDFGKLKKDDYIVVCGDFGLLWDGSKEEQKIIKQLGNKKYTTLFVDGVHENFDLLREYPITEWNGGRVQVISGNLIHLMRGQIYKINEKKIFTFGGGESSDIEMRTEHKTWWLEEMPSMAEMEEGIKNLVGIGWDVDYIFTHEAPGNMKKFINLGYEGTNALNVYLDHIDEKCSFKKWIFGCYHKNKHLSQKHEMVFDNVIKLD